MPESELFLLFVRRLNDAGVRYVIGGSVASIFYGEPRLTNDVDIVVFLNTSDIQRLPELFPASGFYLPPLEVMITEVMRERRGHFNILHKASSFKADIYPTGRDEFNAWAFRNKRSIQFQGATLVLARPNMSLSASWNIFGKEDRRNICGISAGFSMFPAQPSIAGT